MAYWTSRPLGMETVYEYHFGKFTAKLLSPNLPPKGIKPKIYRKTRWRMYLGQFSHGWNPPEYIKADTLERAKLLVEKYVEKRLMEKWKGALLIKDAIEEVFGRKIDVV